MECVMNRVLPLLASISTTILLVGCGASQGPQEVIYSSTVDGQLDGTGTFGATFLFAVNEQDKAFSGVLQGFRFSKKGFEHPVGSIPVKGTIGRDEKGEILLKGTGTGTLSQGKSALQLEFQMESSYVDPDFTTVSAWYFGGGNFTVNGDYKEWSKITGTFTAKEACRPNPYKDCRLQPGTPVATSVPTVSWNTRAHP